MIYEFEIDVPAEPAAGLNGVYDHIEISLIGHPGGEDSEFAEFMTEVLDEWYDYKGATMYKGIIDD
jgi:hypothetical protein